MLKWGRIVPTCSPGAAGRRRGGHPRPRPSSFRNGLVRKFLTSARFVILVSFRQFFRSTFAGASWNASLRAYFNQLPDLSSRANHPSGGDGLGPGSTATSAAVIRGLDLRCRLTVSAETLAGLLLLDCPSLFNRAPRSESGDRWREKRAQKFLLIPLRSLPARVRQ